MPRTAKSKVSRQVNTIRAKKVSKGRKANFKSVIGAVGNLSVAPSIVTKARHSNINDDDRCKMLSLYINGMPVADIAYKLAVAPGTVYRHLQMARWAGFLRVEHKRGRKAPGEKNRKLSVVVSY